MDRGAWQATVHRVAKSRTRLSNFTSLHFNIMQKYPNLISLLITTENSVFVTCQKEDSHGGQSRLAP